MIARDIFEDLFVLEMTNNHLGQLQRGLEIIRQHSRIVRFNNTRTAIKLQFRDLENFIHRDFRTRTDVRYIRRVTETSLSKADYGVLVDAIRQAGCIPMATPFDEKSVDWCVEFNMPIIKIASAGFDRLAASGTNREDQKAGHRLGGRYVAKGPRRYGDVLWKPPYSAGH